MDEGFRRGVHVPCCRGGVLQGRDQEGRRWILAGGGCVFIKCRGGEGFGQWKVLMECERLGMIEDKK